VTLLFRALAAAVATVSALACASVDPNPVDVHPVARLAVPEPGVLARKFPEFEVVATSAGKRPRANARPGNGMQDWVTGSFTYVPDPSGDDHGGAKSWVVDVDLVTFQSSDAAEVFRRDRCWMMEHDFAKTSDVHFAESSEPGVQACKAPIMQLKQEEYDLPVEVPISTWVSGAVIRNDRLVIRLAEHREGGGRGTALDWALAKIAARLAR
jgi:hypothetical protein